MSTLVALVTPVDDTIQGARQCLEKCKCCAQWWNRVHAVGDTVALQGIVQGLRRCARHQGTRVWRSRGRAIPGARARQLAQRSVGLSLIAPMWKVAKVDGTELSMWSAGATRGSGPGLYS